MVRMFLPSRLWYLHLASRLRMRWMPRPRSGACSRLDANAAGGNSSGLNGLPSSSTSRSTWSCAWLIRTLIQWLAYAIPLVAALSLLLLGSESESNFTFRLLVAALIVLGMFGFIVTSAVTRRLSRVIVALTKPKG